MESLPYRCPRLRSSRRRSHESVTCQELAAPLISGDLARLRARGGWGADLQRRCTELLAELETVLDAETLERLLAKGKALDEEAVCALTLETEGCG